MLGFMHIRQLRNVSVNVNVCMMGTELALVQGATLPFPQAGWERLHHPPKKKKKKKHNVKVKAPLMVTSQRNLSHFGFDSSPEGAVNSSSASLGNHWVI